jgi:hypothetical protein
MNQRVCRWLLVVQGCRTGLGGVIFDDGKNPVLFPQSGPIPIPSKNSESLLVNTKRKVAYT